MSGKDGCKSRLEVATVCYILYLFGEQNFIFIREKSGNSHGNVGYLSVQGHFWLYS